MFTAGTILAPLLESSGHPLAIWLRLLYAPVCHQEPARCLQIHGLPMAVCARCLGIYTGGTAAFIAAAVRPVRLPRLLLAAAVGINSIDVALGLLGLPSSGNTVRTVLGATLGLAAGLVAAEGIGDMIRFRFNGGLRYSWRRGHGDKPSPRP